LSQAELFRLLDALDEGESRIGADRREYERLRYRLPRIFIWVPKGKQLVAFAVPTRNISRGGLAFLHSQMMRPGQRCGVLLPTIGERPQAVKGTVVHCRYVRAMVHEIGVQFDEPINLDDLRYHHDFIADQAVLW